MPHLSHHRDSGPRLGIIAAVVVLFVSAVVTSILCLVHYGSEEPLAAPYGEVMVPEQPSLAAQAASESFEALNNCRAERKISISTNGRLEDYFTTYLLCAEPALASDRVQLSSRLDYMTEKFKEACPSADLDDLLRGGTIQIVGATGTEWIDSRYTGCEPVVP